MYVGGSDTVGSLYLPNRSIITHCQIAYRRLQGFIPSMVLHPHGLKRGTGDRPAAPRRKTPSIPWSSEPSVRLYGVQEDRSMGPAHTARFVMTTYSCANRHLSLSHSTDLCTKGTSFPRGRVIEHVWSKNFLPHTVRWTLDLR